MRLAHFIWSRFHSSSSNTPSDAISNYYETFLLHPPIDSEVNKFKPTHSRGIFDKSKDLPTGRGNERLNALHMFSGTSLAAFTTHVLSYEMKTVPHFAMQANRLMSTNTMTNKRNPDDSIESRAIAACLHFLRKSVETEHFLFKSRKKTNVFGPKWLQAHTFR